MTPSVFEGRSVSVILNVLIPMLSNHSLIVDLILAKSLTGLAFTSRTNTSRLSTSCPVGIKLIPSAKVRLVMKLALPFSSTL